MGSKASIQLQDEDINRFHEETGCKYVVSENDNSITGQLADTPTRGWLLVKCGIAACGMRNGMCGKLLRNDG